MKPADSILTFALVPLRIRIINAVIALCIAAACLQVYSESLQVPVIGLILLCISIGAAGLIDCWQFDYRLRKAEYRMGFLFPLHKVQYGFDEFEGAGTERFTKGFRALQYAKCILYLKNGSKKTITVFPVARNTELLKRWEALTELFPAD